MNDVGRDDDVVLVMMVMMMVVAMVAVTTGTVTQRQLHKAGNEGGTKVVSRASSLHVAEVTGRVRYRLTHLIGALCDV